MSLPKSHTIGARLLLAFGASTLVVIAVCLVAWFNWNKLESQVSEVLQKSVPKFNASYVLESRSSEIRRRIQIIGSATNKVVLDSQTERLQQDFLVMDQVWNTLANDSEVQTLRVGYQRLRTFTERYSELVSQRIDVQRQIDMLIEQLQWTHQDINWELTPLRQELQWQLERGDAGEMSGALLAKINLIQSLLDSEAQIYTFSRELMLASHQTQVENGMKVLQYRLEELQTASQPIFEIPASIAYQQMLGELAELLVIDGPFHRGISQMVRLNNELDDLMQNIQQQLSVQHAEIAKLVELADNTFTDVQNDTTQMIREGNRVLLACFGVSICLSLILAYYFVKRRIVARLANLSNSLDAIIHNDLSHPIVVDGKDEIGKLSKQLIEYGRKVEEMERTNALSLINNTQASLITCNLQGVIESANPSAQATLKLEVGKLQQTLWRCFPEKLRASIEALFAPNDDLIRKGAQSVTLSLGCEEKPHYLRLYLRKFNQGLSDKIIVTITDVTDQEHANRLLEERVREKTRDLIDKNEQLQAEVEERERAEAYLKRTQNELIQAAKMAVVGQTMTSLAHELNQPLSAMSTYLFTARLALEQAEHSQIAMSLDQVESLTERMGKIVNSLRNFARKSRVDEPLQALSLQLVVEQALTLVQAKAKRQQVALSSELAPDLRVMGDALGLEQVLINLLVNGCDAVSNSEVKRVTLSQIGSDDHWHRIAVEDSGAGFAHDVVGQLFTPFTSTKEVGLGLGLSICQSLIEKMNGNIYLASTLDKGAMVVLELAHD
ncbi:HAMP domain-containing protein [Vibrio fluvialis]|nr:HAMP domain-containing protein [Vibrio fluvialis]ELV8695756.1 HAMP domain-containing protein [Vibrio fluvialis]MBY8049163.1 HAMP domain-containing protein [Vibrio fluvialis]